MLEARIAEALAAEVAAARATTGAGTDPLTPGERRVVDLATDGLTSDEIADALFLTVKTVDWQLRSACAKLGVAGPGELLGALPRTTPGVEV